jgi:hypothetical protein
LLKKLNGRRLCHATPKHVILMLGWYWGEADARKVLCPPPLI